MCITSLLVLSSFVQFEKFAGKVPLEIIESSSQFYLMPIKSNISINSLTEFLNLSYYNQLLWIWKSDADVPPEVWRF